MTTYYLKENNEIIKSSPFEKVAKTWDSYKTTEENIVLGYDVKLYFESECPVKPSPSKEEILAEKRKIRNQYLQDSDKYVLIDFPITAAKLKLAKEYRQYLRDFFEDELAALTLPIKTFEEYIGEN